MIKIFSGEKIIYLIDDQNHFRPSDFSVFAAVNSKNGMERMYDELINKNWKEIWLFYPEIDKLYEFFSGMFKIVSAAGGLVSNEEGAWLFIFRNGKWDLPKGKIEKNEKTEKAALREVEEECGIGGLSIVRALSPTYHIYEIKGKKVLKPTYWFEMTCSGGDQLMPQEEEGITDVQWINSAEFKKVRSNTYGSILEVIKAIPASDQ